MLLKEYIKETDGQTLILLARPEPRLQYSGIVYPDTLERNYTYIH
jgi:hypothetical protein